MRFFSPDGRTDGLPVTFSMAADGSAERRAVRAAVEAGGGALLARPEGPHCVQLLGAGQLLLRRREEVFRAAYVTDCVAKGELLPGLAAYRAGGGGLLSALQPHDPVEVLLGQRAWADIPRAFEAEGERVAGGELSQGLPASAALPGGQLR